MASWLKAAENLLEAVDRTVQSATGISDDSSLKAGHDLLDSAQSRGSDFGEEPARGPPSGYGLKLGAIPFASSSSGAEPFSSSRPGSISGTTSFLRSTPASSSTSSPARPPLAAFTAHAAAGSPAAGSAGAGPSLPHGAAAAVAATAPSITAGTAVEPAIHKPPSTLPVPFTAAAAGPSSLASSQSVGSTGGSSHLGYGPGSGPPSTTTGLGTSSARASDSGKQQAAAAWEQSASSTPTQAAAAEVAGAGAERPEPAAPAAPAPPSTGSSGQPADVGVQPTAAAAAPVPPPQPAAAAAVPPPTTSFQPAAAGVEDPGLPAVAAAGGSFSGGASGGAKDAQLTRVVDTLRKRLDAYKAENQQLEDMLAAAEQRAADHLRKADALQRELEAARSDQEALVNASAATATAQDVQITRLRQELDSTKQQLAGVSASLAALQQQHQDIKDTQDSIEGGALEALRAQLAEAEQRLDAERRAHQAAKASAAAREADLEGALQEGSGALAGMQRALEEAVARVRDMEAGAALMGAENAALKQQVSAAQAQAAAQLSPEQLLQQQAEREALQEELAAAQQQASSSSSALAAAQTQVAALQQQVAQLQDAAAQAAAAAAAGAGGGGQAGAEQQLGELRELLYQKQAQLERVTADKAAQQLLLERQVASLRDELGKANAAVAAARMQSQASSSRMAHDIIPMDALGEPYQRLARHSKLGGAVQASANFLDSTVATAMQLLRQQPLARLAVVGYVVLIHLYVYFLLARMQRQALMLVAKEHGPGTLPGVNLPH